MADTRNTSTILLSVLLVAVALGLGLLAATVGLPMGGMLLVGALALGLFLLSQLLLFRALGLRSDADRAREEDSPGDGDWRAWKG